MQNDVKTTHLWTSSCRSTLQCRIEEEVEKNPLTFYFLLSSSLFACACSLPWWLLWNYVNWEIDKVPWKDLQIVARKLCSNCCTITLKLSIRRRQLHLYFSAKPSPCLFLPFLSLEIEVIFSLPVYCSINNATFGAVYIRLKLEKLSGIIYWRAFVHLLHAFWLRDHITKIADCPGLVCCWTTTTNAPTDTSFVIIVISIFANLSLALWQGKSRERDSRSSEINGFIIMISVYCYVRRYVARTTFSASWLAS